MYVSNEQRQWLLLMGAPEVAIASALCQEHVNNDNVSTGPSSDGGYRVKRISVTTMFVQNLCRGQQSTACQ